MQNKQPEKNPATQSASTAGMDAITAVFAEKYPNQEEHLYCKALVPWRLGGDDPLDGISIYDGGEYWHFVTYGLSELYEKENEDLQTSGYGMEFTLKLKKIPQRDSRDEISCICSVLQEIAKMTFQNGECFLPNEYLYTGQQTGLDAQGTSKLTGFITIADDSIPPIITPNGKVCFVEFIGATDAELCAIQNGTLSGEVLYQRLGNSYTDYSRDDLSAAE